jgi:hypothetical protein
MFEACTMNPPSASGRGHNNNEGSKEVSITARNRLGHSPPEASGESYPSVGAVASSIDYSTHPDRAPRGVTSF